VLVVITQLTYWPCGRLCYCLYVSGSSPVLSQWASVCNVLMQSSALCVTWREQKWCCVFRNWRRTFSLHWPPVLKRSVLSLLYSLKSFQNNYGISEYYTKLASHPVFDVKVQWKYPAYCCGYFCLTAFLGGPRSVYFSCCIFLRRYPLEMSEMRFSCVMCYGTVCILLHSGVVKSSTSLHWLG